MQVMLSAETAAAGAPAVSCSIPDNPIAWIKSSTRRVETPPIHAFWITAASAFSETFRASRKGGK